MLSTEAITKSFGPVRVLDGVSLTLARGEIHALLGENGAGKSTLMKVLVGVHPPDGGSMTLDGASYLPRAPREARRRGVVIVPQERTLCPDLTVAENIVLGLEPARGGILARSQGRAIAARALDLVCGDRPLDLGARARSLGVADQQLVEIARALAQGGVTATEMAARVLVLDEPTSSLGHDDAARLFARMMALRERGLAIVLVTHFLGDVRAQADRYTVLRDGKVRGTGNPRTTPPGQIVREMLGRELEAERGQREPRAPGEIALEVIKLRGAKKPLAASFTLHRGEVFGIAGLVGSGRTELLRMLAGLDRPVAGTIRIAPGLRVGLLSEDRGGEGLMLGRSIADNVALSARGPRFVSPPAVLALGARWIERLAIRARGPAQPVRELSGGNQQKVQLARLLREDVDVLLVDEPTRGIDVASKAEVLALLGRLAREQQKAIVLVSSQLDELVATCDRIAVLAHGVLVPALPAAQWTEKSLLLEAAS